MNANELANLLEVDSWYKLVTREEIATMLRQQQAEIEALIQIIDANNLNQNIGQFVKPTNEPVAIVNTNCENNIQWNVLKPQSYNGYFLYTHPVKELTDEEIEEIASVNLCLQIEGSKVSGVYDFARAILRKVQEK